MNSVEADSKLLWRSSKLTEGKKSKDPVGSSTAVEEVPAALRPKEKREWLLEAEALSIGASTVGRVVVVVLVVVLVGAGADAGAGGTLVGLPGCQLLRREDMAG